MDFRVRVGRQVGKDEYLVVTVVRVADRGQHDAAGTQPGQEQRVDAAFAELLVQVGGGERADPRLADDDVARPR